MAVKTPVDYAEGIYFITFTCQDWLSLLENNKQLRYSLQMVDNLKAKGHYIKGYVIMPNHLHALVDFGISTKALIQL